MRLKKIPLPLIFFLELFILILVCLAASGPLIKNIKGKPLFTLILDNSYSMLAGGHESARNKGVKAIKKLIKENAKAEFCFIRAGNDIKLLTSNTKNAYNEIDSIFKKWTCTDTRAKILESIKFAKKLFGENQLIYVYTDSIPEKKKLPSNVRIVAMGKNLPNVAITKAFRKRISSKERIFIEIANFSSRSYKGEVSVFYQAKLKNKSTRKIFVKLDPMQYKHIFVTLPESKQPIEIKLADDELLYDNKVILVHESEKIVKVKIKLHNDTLKKFVVKALSATEKCLFVNKKPELLVTDDFKIKPENIWYLIFCNTSCRSDTKTILLTAPFNVNRLHPLTIGMNLNGVIWAVPTNLNSTRGNKVISHAEKILLSDLEYECGKHVLYMVCDIDNSNVQKTPVWPILFNNIVKFEISNRAGLRRSNYRLGEIVTVKFDKIKRGKCILEYPDGNRKKLKITDATLSFLPNKCGIYKLFSSEQNLIFAVNSFSSEESNLTNLQHGITELKNSHIYFSTLYTDITWIFAFFILLFMLIHWMFITYKT